MRNGAAQLGDGSTASSATPVVVTDLRKAAGIAVGGAHVCARLTDGTVRCWGANGSRQLGREWLTWTPVTVIGLER